MLIWIRGRWGRIALGVTGGAATGGVVFWAGGLSGLRLFVLAGAAAGAVAGLLVHAYSRNIELQGVTITVPQLSELHFVVTQDSRLVAWRLFVETSTRVSTQPLADDDGSLREALTSLYNLFQSTRTVLKESAPSRVRGGNPTVEQLGLAMLNLELRPFLTHWHPLLQRWEEEHHGKPESHWPHNTRCREDLARMQERLNEYAVGLATLAGVSDIQALLRAAPPRGE